MSSVREEGKSPLCVNTHLRRATECWRFPCRGSMGEPEGGWGGGCLEREAENNCDSSTSSDASGRRLGRAELPAQEKQACSQLCQGH